MNLEFVRVPQLHDQSTDIDSSTGTGPVIKEIARRSYDMGADYFYRVSDDTEFHGRWPYLFVQTLDTLKDLSPSPPQASSAPILLGVVGPSAASAPNEKILTHDFVHRTHMDIFNKTYYPEDVSANEHMMSTWMTALYGFERTFKLAKSKVIVSNNQFKSESAALYAAVARSQRQISAWLNAHSIPKGMFDWGQKGRSGAALDGDAFQVIHQMGKFPNLIVECDATTGSLSERANYCANTRKKHGMIPRKSKGSIGKVQFAIWKEKQCGDMFHQWFEYERTTKTSKKSKGVPTTFHKLPMPDCLDKHSNSSQPLVAVLAGSTSRKEKNPSNATLSVFTIMLPSLMRSLDCGFQYLVVIGYDKGDLFYDSEKVS